MSNGVDFRKLALDLRAQLTAAQSELAALREELAKSKVWASQYAELESVFHSERDIWNRESSANSKAQGDLQQRLADSERRNAELTDLIEKAHTWVDRNNCGGWDAYELRDRLADALKPTESGASE